MTTFHHHYFAQSLHGICVTQSHYKVIFMKQNMKFGLILGQLAIQKKNWAVKYDTFEGVFLCFHGQKKSSKFVLKIL